ncbi:tspB domain protein [Neisseria meningitidis 70030]|nr:tspB domain protein [Neisseria meningitidis 70030]
MYAPSEKYNDNGFKAYKVLGEGGGIHTEYNYKFDKSLNLNVLESSTGARSLEKVPVKVTASVFPAPPSCQESANFARFRREI